MSSCKQKTIPELKVMCKTRGVKGFSTMNKDELVRQCCEKFSSEFGTPVATIQETASKEKIQKAEALGEMVDVIEKKMKMAAGWLDTYKKTTGKQFMYGSHGNRKNTVLMELKPREKPSDYEGNYNTVMKFDPISILVRVPDKYVSHEFLGRDGWRYRTDMYTDDHVTFDVKDGKMQACFKSRKSDVTYKYCSTRDDARGNMSKYLNETRFNVATADRWIRENYEYRTHLPCFWDPSSCSMRQLDESISIAGRANAALDQARIVIARERERAEQEAGEARRKAADAKASLKDW